MFTHLVFFEFFPGAGAAGTGPTAGFKPPFRALMGVGI